MRQPRLQPLPDINAEALKSAKKGPCDVAAMSGPYPVHGGRLMTQKKTRAEMLAMVVKRPKAPAEAALHQFQYNHPRRLVKLDIDAVCALCGLEEVDATPEAKKKTARWRWPDGEPGSGATGGSGVLMSTKPACRDEVDHNPSPHPRRTHASQSSSKVQRGSV